MRHMAACVLGVILLAIGVDGSRVRVQGRQMLMGDEPFLIRGMCYSPVPINESVYFAPYGDYFTADYSFIWLRDLPLIKSMGVNVVRTYGWQLANDHTAFLDAATNNDLYVMATFYMGDATETPVSTTADRSKLVKSFTKEVAKYAEHPSLLFWSFGNELNGVWNKYLQALSKAEWNGEKHCDWDERYDDLGGCWVHKGTAPKEGDVCYETSYCVYSRLFSLLDDAARSAKAVADVLVVSAFADVDALPDKVMRAGHLAASLDAWTAQVYRGDTFGDFFEAMGNATSKPVVLTEYGVDAYHDECGQGKDDTAPCFNVLDDKSKSFEDEIAQAHFAANLTREITLSSSASPSCKHGKQGWTNCTCIGGFLMSWADEYWKGSKAQAACTPTIDDPKFSVKTCQPKAHVTCGNWDTSVHDLCGYWLEAAPDHYVNEEWFGVTSPLQCAESIDTLRPREIYWTMRKLWAKTSSQDDVVFPTCESIIEQRCVELGDGGGQPMFGFIFGSSNGSQPCSGHGKCTTDWQECGSGTSTDSATPCCSCELGFAGVGCAELDARVYVGVGAVAALLVLLVAMLFLSVTSAICRKRIEGDLAQPLMR